MKKVIVLDKKEGETPLEALEKFRKKNSKYSNLSMTYAGRLDPMAGGLLLVLAGEKIKNKEKYLNLDKEYKFTILLGFSTDTYDVLGKVTEESKINFSKKELKEKINKEFKNFLGEKIQKYPIYSSKTVKGKQLFIYARAGEDVELPDRKIFIKKLKLEKIRMTGSKELLKNIEKRIGKVSGDFRQEEILKIWESGLRKQSKQFLLIDCTIKCSSGTYVRSIANSIGNNLKIPALAFSIKRTKVGKFVL